MRHVCATQGKNQQSRPLADQLLEPITCPFTHQILSLILNF